MKHTLLFLAVITLLGAPVLHAQIPQTISYQGRLQDANGDLAYGTRDLTFRIYDVESGGVALWTEAHTAIPVSKGVFGVTLGSVTTLNLPFDKQYWLSVQVNTDPEIITRIRLASSPYSLNAQNAEAISDSTVTAGKIKDNSITTLKIADASITSSKIENGAVDSINIANNAVNTVHLANGAVTTTQIADNAIGTTQIIDDAITDAKVAPAQIVKSLNSLKDDINIVGGTNISVIAQGDSIVVSSSDSVGAGDITTVKLANGAVTTPKLADDAVTEIKVLNSAITTDKIAATAVTETQLADNAVTTIKIIDAAVDSAKITNGAVRASHIATGAVSTSKLSTNAVTATQLANDAVTTNKVQDNAITAAKIANTQVVKSINTLQDAVIISSGDNITIDDTTTPGTISISATSDTATAGSITEIKLANGAVTSAKIFDGTISADDLNTDAVTTDKILDENVTSSKLETAAVDSAKIATGTVVRSLNGIRDNPTLKAGANITITPLGSDITIEADLGEGSVSTGNIINETILSEDISNGTIDSTKMANNSVSTSQIANGTITATKLAPNAITNAALADNAVNSDEIADDAITATKIATGNVVKEVNGLNDVVTIAAGDNINIDTTGGTITVSADSDTATAGSITEIKLADGAVTNAKIGTGAVDATKIDDNAVTNAALADNAVAGDEIQDNAITTDKILNLNVTAAKIAPNAVDSSKIADNTITANDIANAQVVKSINTLTDAVSIQGGTNITVDSTTVPGVISIKVTDLNAGDGNTLDQAYDQGGDGAGRTITADNGPIEITATGSPNNGLVVLGNVGIGINSPSGLGVGTERILHLQASGDVIPVHTIERVGGSTYTNRKWTQYVNTTGGFSLRDITAGGLDRLTIDTQGNLGIGRQPFSEWEDTQVGLDIGGIGTIAATVSSAPGSGLDIMTNAYRGLNGNYYSKIASEEIIRMSFLNGSMGIYTKGTLASAKAQISGWTTAMHIKNDGSVGIGTGTPSSRLTVRETVSDASSTMQLDNNVANNKGTSIQFLSSGIVYAAVGLSGLFEGTLNRDLGLFADNTSTGIRFFTGGSGTAKAFIDPDGKVGIGTVSPEGKLHVFEGNSGVTANSGSDDLIIESNTNAGISILTPNTTQASLKFGTTGTGLESVGSINYLHSGHTDGHQMQLVVNDTTRIQIYGDGGVVVGNPTGGSKGAGSIHAEEVWYNTQMVGSSDRRLKTKIKNLEYGLKDVMALRPVSYNWKKQPDNNRKLGLIAQEVQHVIEEIVQVGDGKDQMMGVQYTDLVPVLIKAVQEQQAQIEDKDAQIQAQQTKLDQQQQILDALLKRVANIEQHLSPNTKATTAKTASEE